jgi:hypothetical protein
MSSSSCWLVQRQAAFPLSNCLTHHSASSEQSCDRAVLTMTHIRHTCCPAGQGWCGCHRHHAAAGHKVQQMPYCAPGQGHAVRHCYKRCALTQSSSGVMQACWLNSCASATLQCTVCAAVDKRLVRICVMCRFIQHSGSGSEGPAALQQQRTVRKHCLSALCIEPASSC